MPELIQKYINTTTNRLVAVIVLVHIVLEALFAGAPSGLELYALGSSQFQYWQVFTYMFLHADWLHLGLNMLALWSFGRVLERVWGGRKLLLFFVLCGLGAAAVHLFVAQYEFKQLYAQLQAAGMGSADFARVLGEGIDVSAQFANISRDQVSSLWALQNVPAVGASGAVYGILVAFALLFPGLKIMLIFLPIPISARYFVPVLLLIDLTAGVTGVSLFGQNIAHFAHLGGALAGFLVARFWMNTAQKTQF